jgi:hypothetical protein
VPHHIVPPTTMPPTPVPIVTPTPMPRVVPHLPHQPRGVPFLPRPPRVVPPPVYVVPPPAPVVPPPAPVVPPPVYVVPPPAPVVPPPVYVPPPPAPVAPPPAPVVPPPVPVVFELTPLWLWPVFTGLSLLTLGLLILLLILHVVQNRKGEKWVRAHVEAVAGAAPGAGVEVMESRTDHSPPTCIVRLEPRADSGTQVLEEVRR